MNEPITPIEQHHYDTITERLNLNRLRVEAEERAATEQGEAVEEHPAAVEDDQAAEEVEQDPAPAVAAVRDAVTRQAVLGALLDEVKKAYADARRDAHDLLEQQHKATGSTKTDATLPDGTKVGSVSRQGGDKEAKVTDEDAFRAWVRDAYPTEHVVEIIPMQVRTSVRTSFAAKILAEATAADAVRYADPATGVIHDVPGVEILPSRAASHRITYGRGSKAQPVAGRDLVAQAWREGHLAAHVLPILAPAPAPSADASQ